MNRLISSLAVCFILLFSSSVAAETQMPSVKQQEKPYFMGIGFALKSLEEYIPALLHVNIIQLKDLQSGKESQPSFKARLEYGVDVYPVKIISPELDKFEADVMEPMTKDKEISTPIGHITLSVSKVTERKSVATGTLRIKTSSEKTSGEFTLLLNALVVGKGGPDAGGQGGTNTEIEAPGSK